MLIAANKMGKNNSRSNRRGGRKAPTASVDLVPTVRPSTGFEAPFNVSVTDSAAVTVSIALPAIALNWRVRSVMGDVASASPNAFFVEVFGNSDDPIIRSRTILSTPDIRTFRLRTGRFVDRTYAAAGGSTVVARFTLLSGSTGPVTVSGTVFGSYVA